MIFTTFDEHMADFSDASLGTMVMSHRHGRDLLLKIVDIHLYRLRIKYNLTSKPRPQNQRYFDSFIPN